MVLELDKGKLRAGLGQRLGLVAADSARQSSRCGQDLKDSLAEIQMTG